VSAIVVDTSSWIEYFAGRPLPELEEALLEGRVFLPPIVLAELMSARLDRHDQAELLDLLASLPLCDVQRDHWVRVGHLRAELSGKGVSISIPDAHVAQCVLDIRAHLLTHDKVSARISKHVPLRLIG